MPVRTRGTVGPRDPARFPADDKAIGPCLYGLVEAALTHKGLPRPAVLGLGTDHVEQYDLLPVVRCGADPHRFIAAVAGQDQLRLVALVGGVSMRARGRPPQQALLAFLEWPDGRWWSGLRPLHEQGLREDWPMQVRCAEDGDPRPPGLGGWWSRARFEQLRLRPAEDGPQAGMGMVH